MPAINGYDGAVSGNGISGTLNTWSATISRVASDVTGFSNSGRNRILGLYDMTGSAGGVINDVKSGFVNTTTNLFDCFATAEGSTVTLTAKTGCAIAAKCVVDNLAMSVSKGGDATITFNFSLATTQTGTTSPFTISWT